MAHPSHIQSAASKSIRPFRSSEEYLEAMKEDLAEWFNTLYDLDIQVDTFLESLETGCHLCRHANNVNRIALDFQQRHPEVAAPMRVPRNEVVFQAKNVVPGSFIARDNVSNFIQWCRQDLGIQDVLMFETNDLVLATQLLPRMGTGAAGFCPGWTPYSSWLSFGLLSLGLGCSGS